MASSSTTIASETIWPTGLDVAAVAGEGKYLYEKKMAQAFKAFAQNFRVSGLAIPGSSANLNITIAVGEAVVAGFYCEIPATQVTAFASVTNHVFLKLTRDGSNKVTGAQYEVNDTGTAPADSLKIGTLTASGAAITATTHSGRTGLGFRRMPQVTAITATGNFTVPDDATELMYEIFGSTGGGGGGGGSAGGSGTSAGSGGQGGKAGFTKECITVAPGLVIAATIGAAGTGGGGGSSSINTPGGAGTGGGSTSFGAFGSVSGSGGGGGGGATGGGPGAEGTAGVGSGGDINQIGSGSIGGPCGAGGYESDGTSGTAGTSGTILVYY